MNQTETRKIRVYGIVQGVGFRPTVSRHAVKNDIHGSVCNKGPYVEIFAQGTKAQVDGFLEDLEKRPPKRAAILKINVEHLDNNPEFDGFEIIESEKTKGEIFVSPDIAICDECKEELYDPNNRRYLHPFINCTCCGPRLTILDALPYDRERTSMKEFPMCPECAEEYNNPESRRFDAQPVCCNDCGPEVYLIGRDERGREAITYTRKVIASGGIAAIKGIGGFHLCCDATNETAVARLRELKRRPMKPFAIMARNMSAVRKECQVTEVQEEVLAGHQKPILLLERLDKADSQIYPSVAPDNPKIGVMLPYAPVQLLIFDYDDGIQMPDYLVMTSGNTSGAPICRDDNDAIAELSHLCDCMLSHNRKIRIRADDSVMDYYKDEPYMIRRSRGYAPLPVMVSAPWKGQVLAVGGELKNSFCIGVDGRFYLSPYVGDLEDLRTVNALRETIGRLETLLEVEPPVVVSDMHPRYNSTMIAEESGLPVIKVQHHYAHILSCMAENDCQEPVIGVSFDGTGYGMDGTIWGGEILLADYKAFQRFGCITPFLQIGGDASSREGWRIAVSMLYGQMKDRAAVMTMIEKLNLCSVQDAKVQMAMADRKINAVMSTSAGRLFDGVSAILGIRKASTFEGEASMALEFTAEAYEKKHQNAVDLQHAMDEMRKQIPLAACIDNKESESTEINKPEQVKAVLNTGALVKTIAEARLAGADTEKLAYFFHWILAEEIIVACQKARKESGRGTVALSGGVFQNQLLLKMVDEGLQKEGFKVLRHRLVPPNDGGIALGQAVYAMGALKS